MSDELLLDIEGHVARVTLNRPKALNSISHALDLELAQAWDRIDADPDIWVAVLGAAGAGASCGGGTTGAGPPPAPARLALGGALTGIGGPLRVLRKPLI